MPTVNDPCSDLVGECVSLLFRPLCLDVAGQPTIPGAFEATLSLQGWGQATVPAPGGGFFHAPNGLIEKYTSIESYVDGASCVWWKITTCSLPANEDPANTIGLPGYRALPSAGTEYRLAGRFEGQPFCFQFSIDAAVDYSSSYIDGCIPLELIETGGTVAPDVDLGGIFAARVVAALEGESLTPASVSFDGSLQEQTVWKGHVVSAPASVEHEVQARWDATAEEFALRPRIDGVDTDTSRLAFDFLEERWEVFGGLSAELSRIERVGAPVAATDATTKDWVEQAIAAALEGLSYKDSVRVATTADVDLSSAPASIDSVTLSAGDRVLVKNQADNTENGIYEWAATSSVMTRAPDSLDAESLEGAAVFVVEGTVHDDSFWVQTETSGTAIIWIQSAGAAYTAAPGGNLLLTGTAFSVDMGPGSGLNADLLDGVQGASFQLASGYTAADVLAKLLTVDGPGSGLNADLLDGVQGASFQLASGYTAADVLAKLLTVDGDTSGVDADLWKGRELTVGTSAPGSPATGDIWIDTTP